MGEQEVRTKLLRICAQIDRAVGRVGPVGRVSAVIAPLMVGAGMALLACEGDPIPEPPAYGVGGWTTTSTATGTPTGTTSSSTGGWGGSESLYGVGGMPPPYGVAGWGGSGEGGGGEGGSGEGGSGGEGGSSGWGGAPPPYGV